MCVEKVRLRLLSHHFVVRLRVPKSGVVDAGPIRYPLLRRAFSLPWSAYSIGR